MCHWESRSMTEPGVSDSIISHSSIGSGAGVLSWRWVAHWPSVIVGIELHGAGKNRLCLHPRERRGEKWHESVSSAAVHFYRRCGISRGGAKTQPTGNSVSVGRK